MDVETALAVEGLGRRAGGPAEGEIRVEDRLDVGGEAVVPLPGEGPVAVVQLDDRLAGVAVQLGLAGDAFLGPVVAVVVLVVEGGLMA